MRGRRIATIVGLGATYVLLSSWFGLTLTPALDGGSLDEMVSFFVDVWSDSAWADIVFVAGTLAAGLFAVLLYQRYGWPASIAGALVAHWLTYLASYSLLVEVQHPEATSVGEAATFVVEWGWPGLLLAAFVPSLSMWWLEDRSLELLSSADRPA